MARTFSDGTEGQPGAGPESTLASGIIATATSLDVQAGHGARFPSSGSFSIRLEDATDPTHFEVVDCSARSTDTLTIGATTFAWDSADKVIHVISKTDLDAFAETADAVMRSEVASAAVLTLETTTSLSLTDLTTSGPAPAATIGASGNALIILTCYAKASAVNGAAVMGFAVSGASTVAASFDQALRQQSSTADAEISVTAMFVVTGLTAGSNTFTAKYASTASSTASFRRRNIVVIPL